MKVGVMHVIDTLDPGGAERVAVDVVNALPRERYRPYLCTTRRDGVLAGLVRPDVGRLRLARRRRFDLAALIELARFVRRERIAVLHAHATALFVATAGALVASVAGPRTALIWHDHYGRGDTHPRSPRLYRWPARRLDGIIAVNPNLAAWSRDHLGLAADRIWYLPNFVVPPSPEPAPAMLPGKAGARLICVANFRPQKDHETLVRAMAKLVGRHPEAHLWLVGAGGDGSTRADVEARIEALGLGDHVTILGQRDDVPALLRAADIGVLASTSEGLPLSLLEYGNAALAVVATDVGQCAAVLDDGRAGLLAPAGDVDALACHLETLVTEPARRAELGDRLQLRVASRYGAAAAIRRLEAVYRTVLEAI